MTRSMISALAMTALIASAAAGQQARDIELDRDGPPGGEPPRLVFNSPGFSAMVTDLAFSPDGQSLAASGADKLVRIWDVNTGALKQTLRGYSGKKGSADGICTAVAYAPDGRALVVGVQDTSTQGAIRVYDTADLTEIDALLPGHALGGVSDLIFSLDGRFLASAGFDDTIILWDWPARRQIGTIPIAGQLAYMGFPLSAPVLVVFDGQGLRRWSALHAGEIGQLTPDQFRAVFPDRGDGPRAEAQFDEVQRLIDAIIRIAAPHDGHFTKRELDLVAGRALMGGAGERAGRAVFWVGLWELPGTGKPSPLIEGFAYRPTALASGPNGSRIAAGDFFGDVSVRDAATGRTLQRFRSFGRPIYTVGFDASGRRIAFGTRPHGPDRWAFNNYAEPEWTFDIEAGELSRRAEGRFTDELRRLGDWTLTTRMDEPRHYALICGRSGQLEGSYTFAPGSMPWCVSFLQSRHPSFEAPIICGLVDQQLWCLEPPSMIRRRDFLGHEGAVTSVAESPDGRILASASLDRTIRIWSLEDFERDAWPDFDTNGGVVHYVVPGGAAARAGIRVGDRWVAMDGVDLPTLSQRYLDGNWPFRPGQRVALDMERDGRPDRVEVTLIAAGDIAEPLLNFFATEDGEWILWTPRGFYDASLNGDRLIGWQVNRGRDRAAEFYLAQQFRKQLFRPDIIELVLETGDVAEAIARANPPGQRDQLDIAQDLPEMEPPEVRILSPADGTAIDRAEVALVAEAVSRNDLPIAEVIVKVNGVRVAAGKDVGIVPPRTTAGAAAGDGVERHRVEFRREIELEPGRRNLIEVVARNAKSHSEPAVVEVDGRAPRGPEIRPALYVLAVGISDYEDPAVGDLKYADRDAAEFAAAWERQEGTVYREVETRVLLNGDATREAILDGLDWLRKSVTQHDVAILFLSGHGLRDERSTYYLATHRIDPERLLATGIEYRVVTDLIRDVRCKFHLYADTCFSGGITGAKAAADLDDPLRDLVTAEVGTVVFTSSTARERSLEADEWQHGAFTKAFLDTVRDPARDLNRPPDVYLSVKEIDYQLTQGVKTLTEGRQHMSTHIPEIFTDYNVARYVTSVGG